MLAVGSVVLLSSLEAWNCSDPVRFFCYLLVACCAAGLKVTLPTPSATMSANFMFIFFSLAEFSLGETLLLGIAVTAVQCIWHPRNRLRLIQVLFNLAAITVAIGAAWAIYRALLSRVPGIHPALNLAIAATCFFFLNTAPVSAVIAFTERKRLLDTWRENYLWSFPFYIVGAAIAAVMSLTLHYSGWQTSLLVVPVVYVIHRSYNLYLGRLGDEKKHAEEVAALHLRTIEALALAIEAKDHLTHAHLQRVQVYALAVAEILRLSEDEREALRAAALLHDIGKLAVPEHIISKPGRLTPEEFEKMKIHPTVGAEILDRVQFPYPVVPIVRCHHERWDGAGYPNGIRGEQIPIGARILSAVDCLDAMSTDRQYRRAVTLDEAMAHIVSESGRAFDPQVVEILRVHYREFEKRAREEQRTPHLSLDAPAGNTGQPAAGFEQTALATSDMPGDFLQSIAAARQEVQALFELAQDLGNSLSLDETLSVLALRLRRIIPWDSMAIYIKRDQVLIPEYVSGDDFRLFSALEIPLGHGLSGWVAENKLPIVNGNPSVESGYQQATQRKTNMQSAIAVPLEGVNGVIGVLTLYQAERNTFSKDHLRILLAISSKVALSIDNALRYRQAESSATTDYLTGLPNARSLFLHLDAETSRARRSNTPVAVLVCDLDGFKQVNDQYGHLEGNRVLRAVASGLKEKCREYDYVARMGGDEFVVVVPGISESALEQKIAEFREVARAAGQSVCGSEVLGLSVGQAFFPADATDAEELLAEADRAMYKQKRDTKDRAIAARRLWEEELRPSIVH